MPLSPREILKQLPFIPLGFSSALNACGSVTAYLFFNVNTLQVIRFKGRANGIAFLTYLAPIHFWHEAEAKLPPPKTLSSMLQEACYHIGFVTPAIVSSLMKFNANTPPQLYTLSIKERYSLGAALRLLLHPFKTVDDECLFDLNQYDHKEYLTSISEKAHSSRNTPGVFKLPKSTVDNLTKLLLT